MVDLTSPGKGASDPNSYADFPREIKAAFLLEAQHSFLSCPVERQRGAFE